MSWPFTIWTDVHAALSDTHVAEQPKTYRYIALVLGGFNEELMHLKVRYALHHIRGDHLYPKLSAYSC